MAATALGKIWEATKSLLSYFKSPAPQTMSFAGLIPGASILTSLGTWLLGSLAIAGAIWGTVAYLEHRGKEKLRAENAAIIAKFNAGERERGLDERLKREAWEAERRAQAENIAMAKGLAIAKDGTHYVPDDVVDQINRIKRRVR